MKSDTITQLSIPMMITICVVLCAIDLDLCSVQQDMVLDVAHTMINPHKISSSLSVKSQASAPSLLELRVSPRILCPEHHS